MPPKGQSTSRVAHYLGRAESVVLVLIAVVLIALALALLGSGALSLLTAVANGQIHDSAFEIFDSVLLVLMTMEIVYTVTVLLETRKLVAEPFLVVGAIAAIRRILVITAEGTQLIQTNMEAFRMSLVELGLLAFIVIGIVVSIYVLRRSEQFIANESPEEEMHRA